MTKTISGTPVLEVRGIEVRYGGVRAVADAHLQVSDGEIVALIGPNGAGKTSLFNAIAGVVRPSAGTVLLDGRPLDGMPHERARRGLARTFQAGRLFGRMTLRDNLEVAQYLRGRSGVLAALTGSLGARIDRKLARERTNEVIAAVALEEFADMPCRALPYGIQRIAEIARALCIEPRILLLDEPSAGLDSRESEDLNRMIKRIRDLLETPVLLIEHDMTVVMEISDYIYVMDFGWMLAQGTPDEVRSDERVISAYLGDEVA
ncbi:MAG: ABC transporter ATP-binding protein [Actinomycetota bacterium]